jgi:hypothetical protein
MISKLDRSCNWDNKNRPAIATRINSLSSLLLENIGSPTKQWFADNLRHLPLPPVTPSDKVESSAYPEDLLTSSTTLADAGMRNFAISFLFKREPLCSRKRAVIVQTGYLENTAENFVRKLTTIDYNSGRKICHSSGNEQEGFKALSRQGVIGRHL